MGQEKQNRKAGPPAYDSLSHLLNVLHQAGSSTVDGAGYTYDPAGNRTSKTNYLDGTTSNYTYDALYQLLQVTQGSVTSESYTYDPVGNRLTSQSVAAYNYNASNQLTSTSNATYTYDYNGNTLTKTDTTGTTQYAWDLENRLTSVTLPDTGNGPTVVTFKYDPFGRRIQKSSPSGVTDYLYDGANDIEEVDNSGNVLARYTQGKSIDEHLAQIRSGTASYYQQDGLGSVTSLSNSTGTVAETYTYDGYGRVISSSGTLTNPFQYTGREFDSETGIYYYRARYLDPGAGRFLSEDRLRFDQGPNFYGYVRNNPLRWVDPTGNGHTCWSVTPNGQMTQIPCANDCLGNVCNVTPTDPPPPLLPPGSAWDNDVEIMNRIGKCLSEEIEEINQIEIEAANESFMDLPWLPGKSLALQGVEAGVEQVGAEGMAHAIPYFDYVFLGWDTVDQVRQYNEFKKKLKDAQQRGCSCIQNATNQ